MSDWNNINDLDGWTRKLGELLQQARAAAQQKELKPRLEINEALMQFVEHSWPNTAQIQRLDDIATETASALMRQTIEERLESITARTGAYQKLTKEIESLAEATEAKAESIRLSAITSFIDSATRTVESAKALKQSLSDNAKDAKLVEKIEDVVKALEELRTSAGKRV